MLVIASRYGHTSTFLTIAFCLNLALPAWMISRENLSPVEWAIVVAIVGLNLAYLVPGHSQYISSWGDQGNEFHAVYSTLVDHRWEPESSSLRHNKLLTLTILSPVIKLLTNVSIATVFKFRAIVLASVPIMMFIIHRRYMSPQRASIGIFALIFMHGYYRTLSYNTRTAAALLLFLMFIYGSIKLRGSSGRWGWRLVVLVSVFGMVSAHYATSFLAAGLLFVGFLTATTLKLVSSRKLPSIFELPQGSFPFAGSYSAAILVGMAVWYYSFIGKMTVEATALVVNTIREIPSLFVAGESGSSGSYILVVLQQVQSGELPISIAIYVLLLVILVGVIGVGGISLIYRDGPKLDRRGEYLILYVMGSAGIAMTILPTREFNPDRVVPMMLVLLAPAFVLGTEFLTDIMGRWLLVQERLPSSKSVAYGLIICLLLFGSGISANAIGGQDYSVNFALAEDRLDEAQNHQLNLSYNTQVWNGPDTSAASWFGKHVSKQSQRRAIVHVTGAGRWSWAPILSYGHLGTGAPEDEVPAFAHYSFLRNQTIQSGDYVYLRDFQRSDKLLTAQRSPTHVYYDATTVRTRLELTAKVYSSGAAIYHQPED